MMKNEYKLDMDQIHAPQDLVASTKKAMKEEEVRLAEEKKVSSNVKNNIYTWRNVAIAASVCLVMLSGGIGYYKVNNHIVVNSAVIQESNNLETGISLGKIDMEDEMDNIKVEQFDEKTELLNKLWETTPSKIKGSTVYIVQGEDTDSYYGAYKKGEQYYLVTAKSISKEKFIAYLKKNL